MPHPGMKGGVQPDGRAVESVDHLAALGEAGLQVGKQWFLRVMPRGRGCRRAGKEEYGVPS